MGGRVICSGLPTCDCQQSVSGVHFRPSLRPAVHARDRVRPLRSRDGAAERGYGVTETSVHVAKPPFGTFSPEKRDLVPFCYPARSSLASNFSLPPNSNDHLQIFLLREGVAALSQTRDAFSGFLGSRRGVNFYIGGWKIQQIYSHLRIKKIAFQ